MTDGKDFQGVFKLLKEKVQRHHEVSPDLLPSDKKTAIIAFIDNTCIPLVSKLVEVVKFITAIKPMKPDVIEKGCAACEEYVTLFRKHMVSTTKHSVLAREVFNH